MLIRYYLSNKMGKIMKMTIIQILVRICKYSMNNSAEIGCNKLDV